MPSTPPDNAIMVSKNQKALDFRRLLSDKPDLYEQVENYSLLGAKGDDLAALFRVDRETWLYYVKHSEELRDAIARGGALADAQVAKAMHKRATGYEYTRQRVIVGKDGKGVVHDLIEHVPPDTSAGKFWLTNRDGRKWADRGADGRGGQGDAPRDQNITINFVGAAERASPPIDVTPSHPSPAETPLSLVESCDV